MVHFWTSVVTSMFYFRQTFFCTFEKYVLILFLMLLTRQFNYENTTPIQLGIKKSRSLSVDKKWLKYYFCKIRKVSWPTLSALSSHSVFVLISSDQSAAIRRANKVLQTRARAHFCDFSIYFHIFSETVQTYLRVIFLQIHFSQKVFRIKIKVKLLDFQLVIRFETRPAEAKLWF